MPQKALVPGQAGLMRFINLVASDLLQQEPGIIQIIATLNVKSLIKMNALSTVRFQQNSVNVVEHGAGCRA